jgi:serine/threonine protein kinase
MHFKQDLLNFLKLCFKKNPVERPTAQHLLHHPWVTQQSTIPPTCPITPVARSNSTILNNYLKKTTKKDDKIILDTSNPMKIMSPSPVAPYYSPISNTLIRQHELPTFQPSKSLFASKFNQRQDGKKSLLTRQSMPIVSNQYQQQQKQEHIPHVHNLIECSFPKGKDITIKMNIYLYVTYRGWSM